MTPSPPRLSPTFSTAMRRLTGRAAHWLNRLAGPPPGFADDDLLSLRLAVAVIGRVEDRHPDRYGRPPFEDAQ